jgi:putative peptidoglycan lipid II flippase
LLYNLAVIVGALLGHRFGVTALAWAVVVGAVGQLVIQAPGIWKESLAKLRPSVDWSSAASREVLRLFGPRIVGLAAFQAMLFITLFLAARLPSHMVNAINYSWPVVQFPVGALGIAAGTAIFPTLARLSTAEDRDAVRRTVNRSLRLVLFLALPATVGLVVLRRPVVNLLYAHGPHWQVQATEDTAFALLFYALALAPLASIEILARVFYAMRDTKTPVRIAVVAVGLDAALSIVLVAFLPGRSGQGGLALATAIATTIQVAWLTRAANRSLGGIGMRTLTGTVRDSALASLAMGSILYVLLPPLTALVPQHGFGALLTLVVEVPLGAAVFVYASYLLGAPELWWTLGLVRRRSRAPINRKEGSETRSPLRRGRFT